MHRRRETKDALLERTLLHEIMISQPTITSSDADVKRAAQQMLELDAYGLFVEHKGELVRAISQSDVVLAVATAKG